MIRIGGSWWTDGQERQLLEMPDGEWRLDKPGIPVRLEPKTPSPSTLAQAEVIDYVLSLDALAGEPYAKAHETYRRFRSQALPLVKAQRAVLERELATATFDRPDVGQVADENLLEAEWMALELEIAAVYGRCLEALKVLWLTEFTTEPNPQPEVTP